MKNVLPNVLRRIQYGVQPVGAQSVRWRRRTHVPGQHFTIDLNRVVNDTFSLARLGPSEPTGREVLPDCTIPSLISNHHHTFAALQHNPSTALDGRLELPIASSAQDLSFPRETANAQAAQGGHHVASQEMD